MKYELKLAAIRGEIIPLYAVANAMALHDATAGGTPYHEPTFKGRLTGYILCLLEEVRSGRLKVCDTFGSPLAVDETIEATKHFGYAIRFVNEPDWEKLRKETPPVGHGVRNFSHIDFGPQEIDKDSPNIYWFATLKRLNEWAEERGHSFVISSEGIGWYDERGYISPSGQDTTQNADHPESKPNMTTTESISSSWVGSARMIGAEMVRSKKSLSLDQIAQKVHEAMLIRHRAGEAGMTGRGGKVPSAGSIRRSALQGLRLQPKRDN